MGVGQPTAGGTTSEQVVLGGIRKEVEEKPEEQASKHRSSVVSASVPASRFPSTLGAETHRSLETIGQPAGSFRFDDRPCLTQKINGRTIEEDT